MPTDITRRHADLSRAAVAMFCVFATQTALHPDNVIKLLLSIPAIGTESYFASANILSTFQSDVKENKGSRAGSYSNAPLVAELPEGSFFGDPMQRTVNGDFSFTRRCCAQARTVARKRNTPTHRGGALHWQEL